MKDEIKTCQLKCRLTPTEKEKILEYCEAHDMNISDFVRFAISKIFDKAKID